MSLFFLNNDTLYSYDILVIDHIDNNETEGKGGKISKKILTPISFLKISFLYYSITFQFFFLLRTRFDT